MKSDTRNSARWVLSAKVWTALLAACLSSANASEQVLLLDPGHGGADPGFRATGGSESSFVLKTALALETLLLGAGVPARLSRRTDEALAPGRRFKAPAGFEARFILSLHLSGGDKLLGGARFFYAPPRAAQGPGTQGPFRIWGMSPDLSIRSQRLAEQLAQDAGLLGVRVFPLPGASVEAATVPAVILELGAASETNLGGGTLDPPAMAEAWAPFLAQLWGETKP